MKVALNFGEVLGACMHAFGNKVCHYKSEDITLGHLTCIQAARGLIPISDTGFFCSIVTSHLLIRILYGFGRVQALGLLCDPFGP